MCLPEYAGKRKKYSSTASGHTGSPSVMIEGEFKRKKNASKAKIQLILSPTPCGYSLFITKKRESLKENKRKQRAHAGAPLRQITTNHNVGADRCVCPKRKQEEEILLHRKRSHGLYIRGV